MAPCALPSLAAVRRTVLAPCTLQCTGAALVLIGVLCYTALHAYISAQIRAGVLAYAVLSSPSAGQYKGFVDSRDPSGPAVVSIFYFHDYLNPEEVMAGGKPRMRTVGPLTYNYVNTKHNISWDSNGDEIVYTEYQRFFAADDLTRQLEQELITTPDVVLLAALNNPLFRDVIPLIKNDTGALFQRRRVYDVLWGYHDQTPLPNFTLAFPGIQPNDTSLGEALARHSPTRMATGAHRPQDTMNFLQWDGGDNLVCCSGGVLGEAGVANDASCAPAWRTGDASAIRGIFGTAAHPFLSPSETVELATYPFGIYRHWPLQCAAAAAPAGPPPGLDDHTDLTAAMGACDSYSVRGISLLKFAMPPWVLGNASVSPGEAAGYGIDGPSGVLGVAQCFTDAPIFITRPYFLYGSEALRGALNESTFPPGDPALHDSYLGIEPLTGQVLDFHFRLGFSVYAAPVTVEALGVLPMTYFEDLAPVYLPLGWGMQESTVSQAQADTFLAAVYAPLRLNAGAKAAGVGLGSAGSALLGAGLAWAAWARWGRGGGGGGGGVGSGGSGEGSLFAGGADGEGGSAEEGLLQEYSIKAGASGLRGLN